ncbi:MAG: endo-1,4-beta-xylanase [Sedimentisphaerales bacterium]|nr:endo-1,4-beta-xylanase [Sedimentisphaerales bacterium]
MLKKISWTLFLTAVMFSLIPLYADANVLTNPGFETGATSGWSAGSSTIAVSTTPHTGSYSALVSNRTATWSSIGQSLLGKVSNGQTCSITAWARIENASSANVTMTIKQVDGNGTNYHTIFHARPCNDTSWTILSGIFTLEVTGTLSVLHLYLEGPVAGINFYVDDVSVIVSSSGDWETEANQRIEQIRKGDFRITAVEAGNPEVTISDVDVQIEQIKHQFAFGTAISSYHIDDIAYQRFIKNHFEWAVCENASKWWSNEYYEDVVTYTQADNIYDFCSTNNITMRGHCLFWTREQVIQDWIKALDYAPLPATSELRTALEDRLDSAVNHFKGKFMHWDINNEMCDNSYFEDRLGYDIRPWMFQAASAIDPNCMMFLNDYGVISGGYNLTDYKQMAYDLPAQGAPIHALGVQGHSDTGFDRTDLMARLDSLVELNLPIWITEFDIAQPDKNILADDLEDFYRIVFSHPSVEGILMWSFWENSHSRDDYFIVNSDWSLNAAGRRYEAIIDEWTTNDFDTTDGSGNADFSGFYGTYKVTLTSEVTGPKVTTIEVTPDGPGEFTIELPEFVAPTTCQEAKDYGYRLTADLDGNCYVELEDLLLILDQWLVLNPTAITPNYSPDLFTDNYIDLEDLVILSEQWLLCNEPEDGECMPNW